MIYIDLVLNLALLVALSTVSGFIEKRWARQTRPGALLQGILFGSAAVIGMLRPLDLGQGLIFDGRSVMLSLCALFFGPSAAFVASAMTIFCRIGLGGTGTLSGVLVIFSSATIGLIGYYRSRSNVAPPTVLNLYLFGLVVHLAMLALMFTLPGDAGLTVVKRIGPPVMLLYPLATILVGKILSDQVSAAVTMAELQQTKLNLAVTLHSIGDAVISTNLAGEIVFMNPVAEELTGWSQAEAFGRQLGDVFPIINEQTRKTVENPVSKVLKAGKVVGLANHTLLIAKDGTELPIADSAAPIQQSQGEVTGVVMVFRDQSEERRVRRIMEARLTLLEYATDHGLEELLSKALEVTGALVGSPIGYCHFVDADQETLSHQHWLTRAPNGFGHAQPDEASNGIDRAGLWVDCIRRKEAIVYNGSSSPTQGEDRLEGCPEMVRELVAPISREGRVVAILGVRNKPTDYTRKDMETIASMADITWQIIESKRTRAALEESEALFRNLFENHAAVKLIIDPDTGNIIDANQAAATYYGWPMDRLKRMRIQDINTLPFEEVRQEIEKARRLSRVFYEFRHRLADGSIRDVDVFSSKIEVGGRELLHSIIYDITDRRKAEELLRRNQSMLARTEAIAHIGSWEWNIATDTLSWSDELFRIFQRDPTGGAPSFAQQFELFHPEDTARFRHEVEKAATGGAPYELQLRIPQPDGGVRHCLARGYQEKGTDGKALQLFGSIQDITEYKLALERIEHLNHILRAIRDVNQLIMLERDRGRLIREGCRVLVDNRGYTAALFILVDDNDRPVLWAEAGMGEAFGPLGAALEDGRLPPCCNHARLTEEVAIMEERRSICSQCLLSTESTDTFSLCARLTHGGTNFGYLAARMSRGPGIDDEERSLFSEMAGDLAYALYTLQTEEAHEQSERDRKSLESQLLQAQKMEAVGRLAGGVAHDYNNMLGVIIGYSELALDKVNPTDPLRDDLEEILKAAQRSADITRQLLAFARKQTISPKVLDLNETIEGMLRMLRRLIGEDVDLTWLPGAGLWPIKMDPAQIDQILANLCVNARDAIAGVGRITIETDKISFDETYCADHTGFVPGQFVLLAISDDGCGMDRETLDKIFEPFFTTKDVNQGTGLGLATVYGIVKQNDGFINVYSEKGNGTTIRIYLPRHAGKAVETERPSGPEAMLGDGETILIVDDELLILKIGKTMLEKLGYKVLAAGTPTEAIDLVQGHPGEIHMVITDMVMPEMNGRDLFEKLQSFCPDLKSLFMSGYTANVIAHRGVLDKGIHFIQKPFSMRELASSVRELLDKK